MRLCTNCETMVEDSRARLCPNCGAPLSGAPVPPGSLRQGDAPSPKTADSSGKQILRAFLIAGGILLGILVLLVLGVLLLCGVIGKGGGIH